MKPNRKLGRQYSITPGLSHGPLLCRVRRLSTSPPLRSARIGSTPLDLPELPNLTLMPSELTPDSPIA